VDATAPLIRTDSAEVGGVITREALSQLPVFNRNFLSLASLVPGTTPGGRTDRRRELSGETVTIGGASAEANNFIIEGVSNNMDFSGAMGVVPAVDAIQEFALQTSQYTAEFGRSAGGVVNVAIKSGTNSFHGFAYDYLRNDKLDARPFDFTGTGQAKEPLRRNQFGAGLGGPMFRNRTFFFGNYEGIRLPHGNLSSSIVPTALEKRGDFSRSRFTVYDPRTTRPDLANPSRRIRSPFPKNVVPQGLFDRAMVRLLSVYPDPNYVDPNPSIRNNYLNHAADRQSLNSFHVRIDQNVPKQDTMTVRYSEQRGGELVHGWLPNDIVGGTGNRRATNTGLAHTHGLSPTLVNEARFGYNHLRFGNEILDRGSPLREFNIPGLATGPANDGFPNLSIRNISSVQPIRPIGSLPNPFYVVEHSLQWLDNLSWHKRNHALKFGAEFVRYRGDRFQGQAGGATMQFSTSYTNAVVGQALEALRTGLPEAQMGMASLFSTQYIADANRLRSSRFAAFVQDDWRVTKKLTVSPGLRYEIFTPYGELRDRMVNFDFGRGVRVLPESTRAELAAVLNIPNGNLPPTFLYVPRDEVVPHTNFKNFSPRLGFAYAVNSRLAIRGGYGLFYAVTISNLISNLGTTAPFLTSVPRPGELESPSLIKDGFPMGSALAPLSLNTLGVNYIPLDSPNPYSQKYSLNIQVSPFRRTAIEVGFTGQRTLHLPMQTRINTPAPGPGNVQARRPYPSIGQGTGYLPTADSNYNGLEITVRQREIWGLSVHSAFTFSKTLGYGDGIGGTDGSFVRDPLNCKGSYGPVDYDFRKRWVTSVIYRVPKATALPVVARQLLGDWHVSGIASLRGGNPFTVLVSGHTLNIGTGFTSTADVLRNPNLSVNQRTRERWFDTSAFLVPPTYVWGNQGKNILRGPGFAQLDFSLQKSLRLTERHRFTVRMEAENLFNRVNLGSPAATLNAANFGVIRSLDGGPRHIQMVARVDF
jgi:hypothetical protein